MVGFISYLAPLLNYLRRQSPGPPFPPDFRQAGERGAKTPFGRCWCAAMTIAPWIALTAALASAARGGKEAAYGPRAPPPLTRCEASTKCVCAGVYDNWLYERMSGYVYYSSARAGGVLYPSRKHRRPILFRGVSGNHPTSRGVESGHKIPRRPLFFLFRAYQVLEPPNLI